MLMSRLTYDVNLLQDAVTRVVTSFFKDTFTVIGLTAVIFYREWRLALMAMVVFPLAVLIIVHLGKRMRRISHDDPGGQRLSLHRAPGVPHRPAHRQGLRPGNLRRTALLPGQLGLFQHPHETERHPGAVPAGHGVFGLPGDGRDYSLRRLRGDPGHLHPGHLLLLSGRPPHALPAHQEPELGAERLPGRSGRGGAGLRPHGPGAGDSRRPRGREPGAPGPGDRLCRGQLRLRRPGKRPPRHRFHRAPGRNGGPGGPLRGRQIHPA